MAAVLWRDPPFTKRIHAEMMHSTKEPTPRRGDRPGMVLRIRCSVRTFAERLFIGGRTTRCVLGKDEADEVASYVAVAGDPAMVRSEGAWRPVVSRMLTLLPRLARHVGGGDGEQSRWDELVPASLLARIAHYAALEDLGAGQSYVVDVSMVVEVTSAYSEPEALLLSCEGAAVAPSGAPAGDAAAQCPICMEKLLADAGGVAVLPGCSHAFHRSCILKWFHRAATCPSCRRDMTRYLDPTPRARARTRGRGADLLDELVEPLFHGQGRPGM